MATKNDRHTRPITAPSPSWNLADDGQEIIPTDNVGGSSLGGGIRLLDPRLVAIQTTRVSGVCLQNLRQSFTSDAQCEERCLIFQDYLGVTGEVVPGN